MERKINTYRKVVNWVGTIQEYPMSMISTLIRYNEDAWQEVTLPAKGVFVSVEVNGKTEECEVINRVDDNTYMIDSANGVMTISKDNIDEIVHDDVLPMSGMWQFRKSIDNDWLSHGNGLRVMSDLGFRVYFHDEWGYFFGIDGYNFNFYNAFWIPLYEAYQKSYSEMEGQS